MAFSESNNENNNDNNVNNTGTNAYTSPNSAGADSRFYGNGENTSPSQIYNNTSAGNSQPQYHYGRPIPVMDNHYFYEQQQRISRRRDLKKAIRRAAMYPSVSLLFFLAAGVIFSAVLALSPIYNQYFTSSAVFSCVSIFYSLFAVALPFFAAWLIFRGKKTFSDIPLGRSRLSTGKTSLIIFACFGGCLIANYIVNILSAFFEAFGFNISTATGPDPTNARELLLSFVATAIVPPLLEELIIRGFTLEHFKKYGNSFAILASAYIFAIFHGTPQQIPFAFICGLFLGYAACATGSLWTSIIIHALVNGFSCAYTATEMLFGTEAAESIMGLATAVIILGGIICAVLYLALYKKNDTTLKNTLCSELSVWEKFKSFLSNPLIIAATVIFVFEALLQIEIAA